MFLAAVHGHMLLGLWFLSDQRHREFSHVVHVYCREAVPTQSNLREGVALQPCRLEPLVEDLLAQTLHDACTDHLRLQVGQLPIQGQSPVFKVPEVFKLVMGSPLV